MGTGQQRAGGVVGAGKQGVRRIFRTGVEAAIGFLEGAGDVFGPRQQGGGRLLGALGDLAVGVAERRTGLLMQRAGDFQDLFAQRAGDEDRALLEHVADVVDTCRERALHGSGAFLDDAGLAAERLLDLLDIGGDRGRNVGAPGGDLVDMARQRAVDVLAGLGELAEIVFQRAAQHVAAFGQPADMAGDDVVDIAAAFAQLLQVGFQRALEDVAAFGELLDLAGNQPVDAGAAFGQLGKIVFERPGQRRALLDKPFASGC